MSHRTIVMVGGPAFERIESVIGQHEIFEMCHCPPNQLDLWLKLPTSAGVILQEHWEVEFEDLIRRREKPVLVQSVPEGWWTQPLFTRNLLSDLRLAVSAGVSHDPFWEVLGNLRHGDILEASVEKQANVCIRLNSSDLKRRFNEVLLGPIRRLIEYFGSPPESSFLPTAKGRGQKWDITFELAEAVITLSLDPLHGAAEFSGEFQKTVVSSTGSPLEGLIADGKVYFGSPGRSDRTPKSFHDFMRVCSGTPPEETSLGSYELFEAMALVNVLRELVYP